MAGKARQVASDDGPEFWPEEDAVSLEVTSLVWAAPLPAMDKIVLLRLADFADSEGRNVWPSVGRVCRECGVSDRHVQTVIKRYLGQGLLVLVQQGGGRNRTSEYRFDLSTLRALAETPNATTETPNATTLNPEPRSGEPSLTTKEHAADEGACATGADPAITHAVGKRVLELMGVLNDPRWIGCAVRVDAWLASGADPEADIYPVITRLMAKRRDEPPRSLRYFDQAIADAVRNRTTPLPHGDRHAPDHPRSARRRPYDPDESRRRTLEAFPDLVDGAVRGAS